VPNELESDSPPVISGPTTQSDQLNG
jgi:hypothetical protein